MDSWVWIVLGLVVVVAGVAGLLVALRRRGPEREESHGTASAHDADVSATRPPGRVPGRGEPDGGEPDGEDERPPAPRRAAPAPEPEPDPRSAAARGPAPQDGALVDPYGDRDEWRPDDVELSPQTEREIEQWVEVSPEDLEAHIAAEAQEVHEVQEAQARRAAAARDADSGGTGADPRPPRRED